MSANQRLSRVSLRHFFAPADTLRRRRYQFLNQTGNKMLHDNHRRLLGGLLIAVLDDGVAIAVDFLVMTWRPACDNILTSMPSLPFHAAGGVPTIIGFLRRLADLAFIFSSPDNETFTLIAFVRHCARRQPILAFQYFMHAVDCLFDSNRSSSSSALHFHCR